VKREKRKEKSEKEIGVVLVLKKCPHISGGIPVGVQPHKLLKNLLFYNP